MSKKIATTAAVTCDIPGNWVEVKTTDPGESWNELEVKTEKRWFPSKPVEPAQYSENGWSLVGVVLTEGLIHWYWNAK